MRVIPKDRLASHGGWLCVEKEIPQVSALDACLTRSRGPSGEPLVRLGVPLLDVYLEFLAGRCEPNTLTRRLSVASESPWYANIGPDPETLVKAHADFAKMILTLRPSRTTHRPGTDR